MANQTTFTYDEQADEHEIPEVNLQQFLDPKVQRDLATRVNGKLKNSVGINDAIQYHREGCIQATGMRPSDLRTLAKAKKLKAKQRESGRQVLRALRPHLAATVALSDYLVLLGVPTSKAPSIAHQAEPIFKTLSLLS